MSDHRALPLPRPAVTVRRLRSHEWEALRDLRLSALAEAPTAFGEPLAHAERRTDSEWRARAARLAAGEEAVMFVAEGRDGRLLGMTGGVLGPGAAMADVVSVWVRPGARGAGLSRRLIEAVLRWARSRGAAEASLWVTRGNRPAEHVYSGRGFRTTGETKEHHAAPGLLEDRMRLSLAG